MRVFSQINNCQQKNKNKTNKETKQKGEATLLGLAKSIIFLFSRNRNLTGQLLFHIRTHYSPNLKSTHAEDPLTNLLDCE